MCVFAREWLCPHKWRCPQRPEKGVGFSRTGGRGSCNPSDMDAWNQTWDLFSRPISENSRQIFGCICFLLELRFCIIFSIRYLYSSKKFPLYFSSLQTEIHCTSPGPQGSTLLVFHIPISSLWWFERLHCSSFFRDFQGDLAWLHFV